ncbi:MAG: Hpt domain-containing protein [Magnetococcales bacterium]|nr:Hpt domain-containing protein [Magnetococcales bacterium]
MERGTERILVHIDKDLEEIVPGYVQNRWRDVEAMRLAVANKDMESLRVMGHRMKGSGAGYGFDAITEIGRKLESAARDGQIEEITREIDALVAYLQRVDICYD